MPLVMGLVMTCRDRAPSPHLRARSSSEFGEADKRQILREAMRPDSRFSEVARRYGIAERVLFRWKHEITPAAATLFATVGITDANLCKARIRQRRLLEYLSFI